MKRKHPPGRHPTAAVLQFDDLPNSALVDIATGETITAAVAQASTAISKQAS